jgi:hypothetical protein
MSFAMNHKSVLASVLVAGTLLGLASAPVAFADGATPVTTAATTPVTPGTTGITNPEAGKTGDSTASGTAAVEVMAGTRTLDQVVTNLDFGKASMNDLATAAVTGTAKIPAEAFKVTDNSGYKNGWSLTVKVSSFKNQATGAAADDKFDGHLTIKGVELTADDTNASEIFASTDRSTWKSPETEAKITVPTTANVGQYSANMTYTLTNGKANS